MDWQTKWKQDDYTGCPCRACLAEYDKARPLDAIPPRFVVCAICGNKRCPHATDHRLECTGSNEPGQAGSVYA